MNNKISFHPTRPRRGFNGSLEKILYCFYFVVTQEIATLSVQPNMLDPIHAVIGPMSIQIIGLSFALDALPGIHSENFVFNHLGKILRPIFNLPT